MVNNWLMSILYRSEKNSKCASLTQTYESGLHKHLSFPLAFAKFGVPAVTEGVKVLDSTGTELDDDVFEDVVKDPSVGVLAIKYDTGWSELQL